MNKTSSSKFFLFAGLSVMLGIFLSLATLGLVEIAIRFFVPLKGVQPHTVSSIVPNLPSVDRSQAPLLTHVPVTIPAPKFPRRNFVRKPALSQTFEGEYLLHGQSYGSIGRPGYKGRSRRESPHGEVIYDVLYELDEFSRRKTVGDDEANRKIPFLFMGCSFVFGEGLEGNQTLPSYAARRNPDYHFLNYSTHGWGPANLLRLVRDEKFGADLPNDPRGRAVYVYFDTHLSRVLGGSNVYQYKNDWPAQLPYFEYENGNLYDRGTLKDASPVRHFLLSQFSKLELFRFFKVGWPLAWSERDIRQFAAVVGALRDEIQRKIGYDFYIVIYPENPSARVVIPKFDELGLKTLDYSEISLSEYIESDWRLPEGHLGAASHEFLSGLILNDLGLKNKEL